MTTMARQHFQFIADVICEMDDRVSAQEAAVEFAYSLSDTNTRFDSGRFLKACMLTEEDWSNVTDLLVA